MKIYQVDAFTDRPFAGNPAAVCLQEGVIREDAIEDSVMQQIAAEMNLAETAFVSPAGDDFNLRWFTPAIEVDLCGHATLATAHILWEVGVLDPGQTARFHTRSGLLTASRDGEGIVLDFPAQPPRETPAPPELIASLDVSPLYTGFNGVDYMVVVEDASIIRALDPDYRQMSRVDMRGVIVTAPADSGACDFVSRFFAPAAGIDEDPVTGSAHCCLGPYWGERLKQTTLSARQLSPRGGSLTVQLVQDRVKLIGNAVTVLKGEIIF